MDGEGQILFIVPNPWKTRTSFLHHQNRPEEGGGQRGIRRDKTSCLIEKEGRSRGFTKLYVLYQKNKWKYVVEFF